MVALDGLIGPDANLVGGGKAARIDVDALRRKRPELAAKVRLVCSALGTERERSEPADPLRGRR